VNLKIENLSSIREGYGFVERDLALTHISNCIQSHVREQERFARISEDSFILLMQIFSQQQLTQRLDRLYLDIENRMKQEFKDYVVLLKSGIYSLAIHDRDLNQAI